MIKEQNVVNKCITKRRKILSIIKVEKPTVKELAKKAHVPAQTVYNTIFSLRKGGHEIWLVDKGNGRSEIYYMNGPSDEDTTIESIIKMLRNDSYSYRELSKYLHRRIGTMRRAMAIIREEYEVVITKQGREKEFRIYDEDNQEHLGAKDAS